MTSALAGALVAAAIAVTVARPAHAEPAGAERPPARVRRSLALGFNVDLLPTVLSAVNGKLGYAPQIWLGVDHVRVRFVVAHLELPDAFAFAPRGFHHPTNTVLASVIDYTFGEHHDGFWVGAGAEVWRQSIEHDGSAPAARWQSTVATLGAGYIWRFAGNFFVDPWLAGHVILNPRQVSVGVASYRPSSLVAEASLKVGWFFEDRPAHAGLNPG